jgi:hypothetical protein
MDYVTKVRKVTEYLMDMHEMDPVAASAAAYMIIDIIEPPSNYSVDMTDPLR